MPFPGRWLVPPLASLGADAERIALWRADQARNEHFYDDRQAFEIHACGAELIAQTSA